MSVDSDRAGSRRAFSELQLRSLGKLALTILKGQ
jgi:hypothetical protein